MGDRAGKIGGGRGGMSTKKANYTIERRPDYIILECPHCEIAFEVDFDKLAKDIHSEDGHEIWFGDAGVIVTCDYCGQEVELGDADVS
ncbi:hypothetical protein [Listeria welshimeri]